MIIMNYLQGGSRREREIRGNGTAMEVFESHGIGANFLLRHSSSSSSSSSSQTITITSSNTNIEDGKEGNSRASQQRIVQWWTHRIILILGWEIGLYFLLFFVNWSGCFERNTYMIPSTMRLYSRLII